MNTKNLKEVWISKYTKRNDYGEEKTCEFLESTLEKSSIMIRRNIKKGSSSSS